MKVLNLSLVGIKPLLEEGVRGRSPRGRWFVIPVSLALAVQVKSARLFALYAVKVAAASSSRLY